MNDSQPAPSDTGTQDLKEQLSALRSQVNLLLLALAVISIGVAGLLAFLSKFAGSDLNFVQQQAMPVIQAYLRDEKNIQDATVKFIEFGRTHSDFQQALNKYPVANLLPPGSAAPAAPSAPVVPSAPPAPPTKK